ncbi:MAG: UDP-2,3-diacylglucosamine diphosphatase [Planctomycetota bacterium]
MSLVNAQPVRALLVSDVHLGAKHARVDEFLEFLQGYLPDQLYLVGDFFDAWKINSGWRWTGACDAIVEHLVALVNRGTEIYYTPGNHDAFLRQPTAQAVLPVGFPQINLADEFVFESLRGWRFLVTHGDLFDFFETQAQWASKGSSWIYDTCLSVNRWWQQAFLSEGRNPYGACAVLKGRVKRGVKFISRFEAKIMRHAIQSDCDGVICGHIHTPTIKHSDRVLYCNTGDWVENCTGLIERHDGVMQLVSRYEPDLTLSLEPREASQEVMAPTPVGAREDQEQSPAESPKVASEPVCRVPEKVA